MALKIRAARNNLGTSASPYYALASWSEVIETDDFMTRMAAGRTTLSKTDIVAVFQLAREELGRLLAEGCYVKTPLGSAIPRASGKLRSASDPFQPGRPGSAHAIRFDFRLDPSIEGEALSSLRCVRDEGEDLISPRILSCACLRSVGSEGAAKGGDLLRIEGKRLKLDPADERQGLFFLVRGAERRASRYVLVQPSLLIVEVPLDIEPGSYDLAVRTLSRGRSRLEGLWATRLEVSA